MVTVSFSLHCKSSFSFAAAAVVRIPNKIIPDKISPDKIFLGRISLKYADLLQNEMFLVMWKTLECEGSLGKILPGKILSKKTLSRRIFLFSWSAKAVKLHKSWCTQCDASLCQLPREFIIEDRTQARLSVCLSVCRRESARVILYGALTVTAHTDYPMSQQQRNTSWRHNNAAASDPVSRHEVVLWINDSTENYSCMTGLEIYLCTIRLIYLRLSFIWLAEKNVTKCMYSNINNDNFSLYRPMNI